MPFRSRAQKRWMYANKPAMAERWQKETPSEEALPEHVAKRGKIKRAASARDLLEIAAGLSIPMAASTALGAGTGALAAGEGARGRGAKRGALAGLAASLPGMFGGAELGNRYLPDPDPSLRYGYGLMIGTPVAGVLGGLAGGLSARKAQVEERAPDRVKEAEPGPPPGISVARWDRILQRGPEKAAAFPNAAGPEDWDTVGDSPWKRDQPNLTREKAEIKEKQSQGGTVEDIETGDPRQLMPHLRAIHKIGHVKQAAGDADLDPGEAADAQAEADIQSMGLPPGFSPQGYIPPALAKLLFVIRPQQRLQQIQEGLLEEALMRRALGKIGHVLPMEKAAFDSGLSGVQAGLSNAQAQLNANPYMRAGRTAGKLIGGAALGYGLYRAGKWALGKLRPAQPQPQPAQGPMGKVGHVKEAEIFAWPEDMTQAQWNEMLEKHPEQEAQRVRRSRGASVGTLTGALGAAMGAAGLGGLAARHNKWLAIPAGALGAVGGAALGGGLGYGAGYALPSPAADRARQEAEQEAAAARLVDPSRFRKEAQGEFEYAETGPNAGQTGYDPPRVWKLPGQLKRAAGLDQEENLDDQERGTDPPAAQPQPVGERLRTLAQERGPIKKLALASYVGLLDELQKLGEVAHQMEPPPKPTKRQALLELIRKGSPAVGAIAGGAWGLRKGLKEGDMAKHVLTGLGTGGLLGSIPEALGSGADALKRYREVTR